jgi:hypothetical protein
MSTSAKLNLSKLEIPKLNQWNHIAWVGVGGATQTLYINGVNVGTSTSYNLSVAIQWIGGFYSTGPAEFASGYISNLRIVNGTAVYTTDFGIPRSPSYIVPNTVLLTLQNKVPVSNNTFYNKSDVQLNIIPNDSVTQGTVNPFGNGWSGYFDGSGDYLTVPASTILAPLTGDFTYECWVYPTSSSVSYRTIFGIDSYDSGGPFRMYQYGTNFQFWYKGPPGLFINSPTITVNIWLYPLLNSAKLSTLSSRSSISTKFKVRSIF